jgi:hypothetical protein
MSNDSWKFDSVGLSLQTFTGDRIVNNTSDRQHTKVLIAGALMNLENFLVFALGSSYTDVTQSLRMNVLEGAFNERVWSADYVCFEINSAMSDVFYVLNSVSKETFMKRNPEYDISVSTGVQAYMRSQLNKIEPSLLGQVSYESLHVSGKGPQREPWKATAKETPLSSALVRFCLYDLLWKLKCKNVKCKE